MDKIKKSILGNPEPTQTESGIDSESYEHIINQIKNAQNSKETATQTMVFDSLDTDNKNNREQVSKSTNSGKSKVNDTLLGGMSMNPNYKDKIGFNGSNLHNTLKKYSNNVIFNAIVNTRANQVSMFCNPVKYSEKGIGFQVRLKDVSKTPGKKEKNEIDKIEKFILNTGADKDPDRDSFNKFIKKIVRDTFTYDQVNFELVYNKSGTLNKFVPVDPSTIYYGNTRGGSIPEGKGKYVQVINGKIVTEYSPNELAFAVRNPRTDIYSQGYGTSELEMTLKELNSQENTERFNDRFFSHGGTTRGVLHIKSQQGQSQQALDTFKREWKSSLSGINGSWQIPVVNAEDIKFVNMTPTANDMQFEKWLNYLINVISSVFQIDPAEINFPNRGGATGSSGSTLNETSASDKAQLSQNKGLLPLLRFIEDTINQHIVSQFGDKYVFQFVGGDVGTELQKIRILADKTSFAMTINEAREELGLPGDLPGGDIPANGVVVQRMGQLQQQENFEYQKQQDRLNNLIQQTGSTANAQNQSEVGLSFQDIQQGLAGDANNVNGKDTTGSVGKDGQDKNQENTNSNT